MAYANNHFILQVRNLERSQLGGLSLIHVVSVEVAGAGGSTSKMAS